MDRENEIRENKNTLSTSLLIGKQPAEMEEASRLHHPHEPSLNFQALAQSADLFVVHNLRSLNVAF